MREQMTETSRYANIYDCDRGTHWLSDMVDGDCVAWDEHQTMVTAYQALGTFVVQVVGSDTEWVKGTRVNVRQ
jgi:hypothetical protein